GRRRSRSPPCRRSAARPWIAAPPGPRSGPSSFQTVFELWHATPLGCKAMSERGAKSGVMAGATTTSGTKAQLLDVAEQLFLSSGLGVSVRDITDAAGQNGAAIHYHFGSRDGLVGAVIARRAGDLAARRRAALAQLRDAPRPQTIRDVVAGLVG